MLTLETLTESVKAFLQEWDAWTESPEPAVSEGVWESAVNLDATAGTDDVADDAKELTLAVDDVLRELQQLSHEAELPQKPVGWNPGGGPGLHHAVRAMRDACTARRAKRIESIDALKKQGCTEGQIARIYEWKDGRGEYDVERVLHAASSEDDKDAYHNGITSPADQGRQAEIDAKFSKRVLATPTDEPADVAHKPAPESLVEVVAMGVSVEQIIRMGVLNENGTPATEADIIREASFQQVQLPGVGYIEPTPVGEVERLKRMEEAKKLQDTKHARFSEIEKPDAEMTLEDAVMWVYEQGLTKPSEIVEFIEPWHDTSHQNVGRIIKKSKKVEATA